MPSLGNFYRALGFGLWSLGFGLWALGFGLWALGFGSHDLPAPRLTFPTIEIERFAHWGAGNSIVFEALFSSTVAIQ